MSVNHCETCGRDWSKAGGEMSQDAGLKRIQIEALQSSVKEFKDWEDRWSKRQKRLEEENSRLTADIEQRCKDTLAEQQLITRLRKVAIAVSLEHYCEDCTCDMCERLRELDGATTNISS